jgi:Protein of unknown function (DUF2840)
MCARAVEVCCRFPAWPQIEKVLHAIDAIEALGIDPADSAPDYWQHVHNQPGAARQRRCRCRHRRSSARRSGKRPGAATLRQRELDAAAAKLADETGAQTVRREIMQLPPDDELVLVSGCRPIRAKKAR